MSPACVRLSPAQSSPHPGFTWEGRGDWRRCGGPRPGRTINLDLYFSVHNCPYQILIARPNMTSSDSQFVHRPRAVRSSVLRTNPNIRRKSHTQSSDRRKSCTNSVHASYCLTARLRTGSALLGTTFRSPWTTSTSLQRLVATNDRLTTANSQTAHFLQQLMSNVILVGNWSKE